MRAPSRVELDAGLDALRRVIAEALRALDPFPTMAPRTASVAVPCLDRAGRDRAGRDWAGPDWAGPDWAGPDWAGPDWAGPDWLLTQSAHSPGSTENLTPGSPGPLDDHGHAASSATDQADQTRLIALVELARGGDKDAFGQLYDHYHASIFRFVYYRVGSTHLAEDLTGETFFRALRSMPSFRWKDRDFGAWLTTIARNLTVDHYKAGRTRLERPTDEAGELDSATDGPEDAVLESLTHEVLLTALRELPQDQQDCLVMRFLQGLSIAETAAALERSAGAIKQLQLRAVRSLAQRLPEGIR